MQLGATYLGHEGCEFVVWAPHLETLELRLLTPEEQLIPLQRREGGLWQAKVSGVVPGSRYLYRLNQSQLWPDPVSHWQPEGVHQPSAVVDHGSFTWQDQEWQGIPLPDLILYEIHVGTFTPEGTFAGVIERLPDLKALGINALEIMPVAQCPGERNWGYDGVYPFAVQQSFGGPEGLKALVNACHQEGIAVFLDVVYNHFGPEGNYTWAYAPYLTDKYRTPWGSAINFDDAESDGVREYFIQNALHWLEQYHIDGLRLDAVHAIYDFSAYPFLAELADRVEQLSSDSYRRYLIAESDLNDVKLIRPRRLGGYDLDSQWSDDFHHALHALLTGESNGYYDDFGSIEDMAKVYQQGYVYTGQYSRHRLRRHGNDPSDRPGSQFVVCCQNHDQVGNRMLGDRLSTLIPFSAQKLAAAAVLLSPFIPMLFMGEEYGETAPFLYFVHHGDPNLVAAVRNGRREEFKSFAWQGEVPDPQSEGTFQRSKLQWGQRHENHHQTLWKFYQTLIQLRRQLSPLRYLNKDHLHATPQLEKRLLWVHRWHESEQVVFVLGFNPEPVKTEALLPAGQWHKCLDASDPEWLSDSSPGHPLPAYLVTGQSVQLDPFAFALYHATPN